MSAVARRPAFEPAIPGSKSITNRAAFVASTAAGSSMLLKPLICDDTLAFVDALEDLGVEVHRPPERAQWTINGLGGGPRVGSAAVWCADAGTASRFLPALAAAGTGTVSFDASIQMSGRPMAPLLDALRALGVRVIPEDAVSLPFSIVADGVDGGAVSVEGGRSSQFLSALLMMGPLTRHGLRIDIDGELVSEPYVEMTMKLMRAFGAAVEREAQRRFTTAPGGYVARALAIEPDASSASYFFAAAAITATTVRVEGLGRGSLQGDLEFVRVLERMGAAVDVGSEATVVGGTGSLAGIQVDMQHISDTFMTLACIAPYASAPVRITGVGHARLKESDRVAAVAANLERLGVPVATGPDWIEIAPAAPTSGTVDCHRDHRIAMSFSILALRADGVILDDPSCVTKTFPDFHAELARFRAHGQAARC